MRTWLSLGVLIASCAQAPRPVPMEGSTRLVEWQRGFAVKSTERPEIAMYLWFYEWHMFDAIRKGQHTNGTFRGWDRSINAEGTRARIDAAAVGLDLSMEAVPDGAKLSLKVTNKSGHDWPELAAVIPCFSPGKDADTGNAFTPLFANEETYFLAAEGLVKLKKREIHYNAKLRAKVDAEAKEGRYVWSGKWPKAEPDAVRGILIRDSNDRKWVAAVAWEDSLSSQGHNPWRCMHLSVRVGPLKRGESRTLRGRIFLFPGTKEECLERFRKEFGR